MVYWVEFGNGFRERGKDTLPATRRYVMNVLSGGRSTIAYIYRSRIAMFEVESIVRNLPSDVFYSVTGRSTKPINKNGALKKAPDYHRYL